MMGTTVDRLRFEGSWTSISSLEHYIQDAISVRTIAPSSVSYLSEATGSAAHGEHPMSPLVRIDYPALEEGMELPELGSATAPPFRAPLTLVRALASRL